MVCCYYTGFSYSNSVKHHCRKFARKSFVFLLIFTFLFSQFSLLIPSVYAASSPWTQTDWVGGSGQTSWSDNTKFDSSSNVTTSTTGQVTLAATSGWYNTSWAYRRKITFDNSAQAENLTNFPVLIKIGYLFVPEPTNISNVTAVALSSTSVRITWETNHPANGKVNWGYEDGIYEFEDQTDKRTSKHEFVLKNLKPDTEYHYEVMSQNRNYVLQVSPSCPLCYFTA